MQRDLELGALAAGQAGFISSRQAAEHGLSPAAIRWRVEQRLWTPVRNGLYQVNGVEGDLRGLIRGAVAILPEAAASHESAAELHGIRPIPKGKAVVTVYARTTHTYPGVTVHRSLDLAAHHMVTIDNLKTTNIARTLIDLAAVCRKGMVARAMDDMLAVRPCSNRRVGRRVRGNRSAGADRVESYSGTTEREGRRRTRCGVETGAGRDGSLRSWWHSPDPCGNSRRPGIRTNGSTLRGRPGWPGVEGDGRRWHTRVADFERDRRRDRLSLLHQWTILRFTWFDFTKRPDEVLAQVRQLLEQRRDGR